MQEFNWTVRVYYEDTDAAGVVYHSNYLKFMERARTEWLRALDYSQDALRENDDLVFVVRNINLKFHRPARLDDLLDVHTRAKKLGGASLLFEQQVLLKDQLLCHADVDIACLSASTMKPQRIPDLLKAKLNYVN